MAKRTTTKTKGTHGGAREGSGPKAVFRDKTQRSSFELTEDAAGLLDRASRRLGVSRSDVLEGLVRKHARTLHLDAPERPTD